MPLVAPARRAWGDDQVVLPVQGNSTLRWPPQKWKTFTRDQKLRAWEFAALTLERGESAEVQIPLSRGELLDKYNMLGLPGTDLPAMETVMRKARYYTCETLRIITSSTNDTADQMTLLSKIEAASANRDHSTDNIITILEESDIPLRL